VNEPYETRLSSAIQIIHRNVDLKVFPILLNRLFVVIVIHAKGQNRDPKILTPKYVRFYVFMAVKTDGL